MNYQKKSSKIFATRLMLSYAGNIVDDDFSVNRIFLVNRVCSLRSAVCKCHTPILRTIVRSHLLWDPMSCKYRLKCSNELTWLCSLLHSCYFHVSWEVVYNNKVVNTFQLEEVCGYDLPGLSGKGVVISAPGFLSLWRAQTLYCSTRSLI